MADFGWPINVKSGQYRDFLPWVSISCISLAIRDTGAGIPNVVSVKDSASFGGDLRPKLVDGAEESGREGPKCVSEFD